MGEKYVPSGQKVKLQILDIIKEIIYRSQWNQITAAKALGVDQPKVSQIMNGKATGFSLERLLIFLLRLHCTVELSISMKNSGLDSLSSCMADNLDSINLTVFSRDQNN